MSSEVAVDFFDHPAGDASGAAAVRQPQRPDSAPHPEEPLSGERAARVAQLREQYEQGTLQIDAAELSSKIIDKHLEK